MEVKILYSSTFTKDVLKFSEDLQEEVFEAIEKFKNTNNHKSLKVHKLQGRLYSKYSFSINYAYRIVFEYVNSKTVVFLLSAGNHDIYQ